MSTLQKQRAYRFATGIVILAAGCLYLLGAGRVPLWDRDEAWYATTSAHMVNSGDWLLPEFLGVPRYAKPVFIYWCQATSMSILGQNELAARLPSALAMTGTLILLAATITRRIGARRAMYSVLIFATSAMVITSAKMCLTDSVLLLFITVGQLCIFGIYRRHQRGREIGWLLPTILWFSIGLAGLTKGPFALIIHLATLAVLAIFDTNGAWRSWAAWRNAVAWWPRLRPGFGLIVVAAIVAPWLLAVYRRSPDFFFNMLMEPIRHTTANQDGHSGWPGYHLLVIWLTLFPWSLLLPLALVIGFKHRRTPHVRFALSIVIGNWIVAETMKTKLPHYMLPAYSSLAFLMATGLIRCMRRQHDDLHRPLAVWAAGIWAAGATALSFLPWLPARAFEVPRIGATLFTAVGLLYAAGVFISFARRRIALASSLMGGGMAAVITILFTLYLPQAQFLRAPQSVGMTLRQLGATEMGQVFAVGCEPSVGFYQGGTVRERNRRWLAQNPVELWPTWIAVPAYVFDALPEEKRASMELAAPPFRGASYNGGPAVVDVLVLKKKQPQTDLPPAQAQKHSHDSNNQETIPPAKFRGG